MREVRELKYKGKGQKVNRTSRAKYNNDRKSKGKIRRGGREREKENYIGITYKLVDSVGI